MNFYCLDCQHVGPLDVHGRCPRCGSSGVAMGERIEKADVADWEWLKREIEAAYKERK